MPIYAYKCESCGHAKDVLQKISDAPLTQCPACGADGFRKQLTAAGFQLKGSGWYVTDFRGGNSGAAAAGSTGDGDAKAADGKPADGKPVDGKSPDSKPADAPAVAPAAAPSGPSNNTAA